MEMIAETGDERDVCVFYLESAEWDVKAAVALKATF